MGTARTGIPIRAVHVGGRVMCRDPMLGSSPRASTGCLGYAEHLRFTEGVTTPPAYLSEIISYVKANMDAPARVAVALASLLTDDASTTRKGGATSALKDFVSHWLITDASAISVLAESGTPVQLELLDGRWLPSWNNSRRSSESHNFKYNVCISFAGKDRAIAEGIATGITADARLKRRVFYDEFEKTDLWGQDLFNHLHRIYSQESMFCVILFSHAYLQRAWTRLELKAAQSRTLADRSAYVLPVAVDPGAIPPEFSSVGYWSYSVGDEVELLPRAIEAKIDQFIGTNYSSIDEIGESLKSEWINRSFLDAFRAAIATRKEDATALFIVGMIAGWDSTTSSSRDISALLRLILFAPGPVSYLFDSDGLEIDRGYFIRRSFSGSALFSFSGNWLERVRTYFPADWNFDAEEDPDGA